MATQAYRLAFVLQLAGSDMEQTVTIAVERRTDRLRIRRAYPCR